jgi:hypothetical protein
MSQKENDEGAPLRRQLSSRTPMIFNSSIQELESPQLIENVESESVLIAK